MIIFLGDGQGTYGAPYTMQCSHVLVALFPLQMLGLEGDRRNSYKVKACCDNCPIGLKVRVPLRKGPHQLASGNHNNNHYILQN